CQGIGTSWPAHAPRRMMRTKQPDWRPEMSAAEKAIPQPTDADTPYWQAARERRLVLPRCSRCGLLSARPRIVCPRCRGEGIEWQEVSGRGKIYSYAIVWQSTVAGFRDEVPYVVC